MSNQPENRGQEPTAPARFVERLQALHYQTPLVPQAIDDAILSQARAHLKTQPESARLLRFPRWLAAAAIMTLGLGLTFLFTRERGAPSLARGDIDRNGHVDILDAFALARKLGERVAADPSLDLTGDGLIDQQDVDWIAAQAVKLPKG